jgi:hypothetical protein
VTTPAAAMVVTPTNSRRVIWRVLFVVFFVGFFILCSSPRGFQSQIDRQNLLAAHVSPERVRHPIDTPGHVNVRSRQKSSRHHPWMNVRGQSIRGAPQTHVTG